MAGPGLIYENDYLYAKEDELILKFNITAAKTVSPMPISNNAVLTAFDAIASQSVIDNWLGSTNEFLVAAFDATAMGTDAFACIVNMSGLKAGVDASSTGSLAQAQSLLCAQISLFSGSNGATAVSEGVASVATLTASTLSTQAACGAFGNLALRAVLSGVDVLTSGIIVVRLHWVSR